MTYVLEIIHSGKGEDAKTSVQEAEYPEIHNAEAAGRRHTRDCKLEADRCVTRFYRGKLDDDN